MSESPRSREHRLAETFVALTDTLVSDFDVADLLHDLAGACVEVLEVTAAGLMLVDGSGRLRVMSSSSERSRLLELMEIQHDEGPCLDCHREGAPVLVADLAAQRARWPKFADEAIRVGFGAVYALPMRLRSDTVGALNLFHRDPDTITEATLRIGQALADVATIAILQQRAVKARDELSQQLQTALNSRVIIEQAKGVLAERLHIDMSTAFNQLRGHARGTHQQLAEVARAVVTGELSTDQL